jgi:two-component system nitrogen regulation response regulator GlnG
LFHRLNVIRLRLPALRERKEDIPMLTRHFLQHSAKQLGVEPKRISDTAIAAMENFAFPGNVRQLQNICHWLTVMAPAQVIEPKDLPPELGLSRSGLHSAGSSEWVDSARMNALVSTPSLLEVLNPSLENDVSDSPSLAEMAWPTELNPTKANLVPAPLTGWELELEDEALTLLRTGHGGVWDVLTRRFEARLIQAALTHTRGRRIDAANQLGIGRNTITRKIQDLGLDKKVGMVAQES